MSFNPDRIKPAQEVIFSRKTKNSIYFYHYLPLPPLFISTLTMLAVVKITPQNHLVLNLDVRLTFNDHINKKLGKPMESVGLPLSCNVFYHV